jgi:hypothetical protein
LEEAAKTALPGKGSDSSPEQRKQSAALSNPMLGQALTCIYVHKVAPLCTTEYLSLQRSSALSLPLIQTYFTDLSKTEKK